MLASFCPQDLVERERETERARGERYVAKENVLQFERLGSDLQVLGSRFAVSLPALARMNESEMPRFSVEDLAEPTRRLIESEFSEDFDLLGFSRLVLKQLDHPNICKLYEVFEDADSIYIVMDLCHGGELFDRIAEGALGDEAQVAKLIRQLARALRYCHDRGIIHRDIKPENILFVSSHAEAPAKLIDFGIACHFKQTAKLRSRGGTEAYEAPEVQSENYSEKCDMWSLGVLLYAMLSGAMPFKSASDARTGTFKMSGETWDAVSPEAKELIGRLLVPDPAQRLSAEEVLADPWVRDAAEVEAMPAQVAARLKRYQSMSYFRRILLMVVARHLGANDLPEIYDAFKASDTNGDGSLSLEEFRFSFSKVTKDSKDLKKDSFGDLADLFEALDADGSGAIDYSEFMAAAIDRKILFREDLCLQVFRALDRDSSGKISIQELFQLLKDADPEDLLGTELRDEAMELLDRYDVDGDGELNMREFMALLTQNREAPSRPTLQKRNSQSRRASQTTDSLQVNF
ncbi:Calcium-dependent protein kinase 34 [Symbiodinium microadriaticum]|uniref:Calcium-dependent protein kinase 34 n=1 Tax=Symbiodinium microadriaticum TaxID=2951 RepID=A0A1Q9EES4_SYMMI|nr:Calcium-dependent protein kinase 34 [Symbiodinium microadriaticum]